MINLTLNQVTFAYRQGSFLLENFSYQVQAGVTLITGKSGSGKTTLLKIMCGLLPTYGGTLTGEVLLEHQALDRVPKNELAAQIGYLMQNPSRSFAMKTVEDQLLFGLENLQLAPDVIWSRLEEALVKFNLQKKRHQPVQTLSGGEQQKVALAQIYCQRSSLILLDEPFANIDAKSRAELLELIKNLKKQKISFVVCDHDQNGYQGLADFVYEFTSTGLKTTHLKSYPPVENFTLPQKAVSKFKAECLSVKNPSQVLLLEASFSLAKGQIGLLSGPNGSGKSTLLAALSQLNAYQGNIYYDGRVARKRKLKKWAQIVGLGFQQAEEQFTEILVQDEIALAQKNSQHPDYWTKAQVDQLTRKLNLTGVLKQSVYQLSGGQQKKLQLLLLLVLAPPVLLLDEPLAGLDYRSYAVVLENLAQTVKDLNLECLMVSHQRYLLNGYIAYELRLQNKQLVEVRR